MAFLSSPKVTIFVWRVYHNALPTRENLTHQKISLNIGCPRCLTTVEAQTHALKTHRCIKSIVERWESYKMQVHSGSDLWN